MKIYAHSMPMIDGEDFPKSDDERYKVLWRELVADGVMDENGTLLKAATLRRGMDSRGWLVKVELKEMESVPS